MKTIYAAAYALILCVFLTLPAWPQNPDQPADNRSDDPPPVAAPTIPKASDDVLTRLKARIATDPNDWIASNQLGVLFAKRNDLQEALPYFEKAAELNPQQEEILYNLSIVYDRLDRRDEALQTIMRSLTLKPDNPEAMQEMCELFILGTRMNDAAGCYAKLVNLSPKDASSRARYIYTLAGAGQQKQAEQAARDGLSAFPGNSDIYNALGIVQFQARQYKKAAASFKQAIALNGDSSSARFNLAIANLDLNNREGALEQYSLMRQNQPNLAQQLYDFMYRSMLTSPSGHH